MKNIKKKLKEQTMFHGEAILSVCDVSTSKAKRMEAEIVRAVKDGVEWKKYRRMLDNFHSLFLKRQVIIKNTVPTVGRTAIAMRMASDDTYTGHITHCALGDNNTASAIGNTTLGNEVFRSAVSSKTYASNICYISTFFTAAEIADTIEEIGHFIDGAAGADTGQLISRIASPDTAELPVTKSNTESLTADYKLTLS